MEVNLLETIGKEKVRADHPDKRKEKRLAKYVFHCSSLVEWNGNYPYQAAPKIDSSNRGFRLLEAMGWSEGKQIGITGGLDQPLMAIIKHSKLGLGAMRYMKE